MNWDAIGAVGEFVGAITVLATLLYLTQQIRLSNRIAIASSEIEIRNSFGALNGAIFGDSEFASILANAKTQESEVDGVEMERLQAWMRQGINVWLSIETAHKNGLAPKETYELIFDDIRYVIDSHPGARSTLRGLVNHYPTLSATQVFVSINNELEKHDA
jgi:hypothetical protein